VALADQDETDRLVLALRQGDSRAGEALIDVFYDQVFGLCYRLTFNAADAEDLTQETFLRAFRALAQYQPQGQFKAWLLKIATNLFLDEKRSARNRNRDVEDVGEFARKGPGPEEAAQQGELMAAVWAGIQRLSREEQAILTLRAVEGLDYGQIAAMLEMKEGTVRWHMYEARRQLCEMLGARFDLEEVGGERE